MSSQKPDHGHAPTAESKTPLNHCFACGKDNPEGMHLKFYIDEEARRTVCEFELTQRYQGPPGHAHGGIIATILDEAMGKVNKFRKVVALTKKMEIEYLKPVPLGKPLKVIGREQEVTGRQHTNVAEICNDKGDVLARSTGIFIAVDVNKVFARVLKQQDGLQDSQ